MFCFSNCYNIILGSVWYENTDCYRTVPHSSVFCFWLLTVTITITHFPADVFPVILFPVMIKLEITELEWFVIMGLFFLNKRNITDQQSVGVLENSNPLL